MTALVDSVLEGKIHKDYVLIGGQQCALHTTSPSLREFPDSCSLANASADMITTVTIDGFYGKIMSTAAPGGICIAKTAKLLIVAVYSDPVTAAQAIPHVHRFADQLSTLVGPT